MVLETVMLDSQVTPENIEKCRIEVCRFIQIRRRVPHNQLHAKQ